MGDKIRIGSRDKEISTINVELFKRRGLVIQFRTKLYREGYVNQSMIYFHSEFVYKSKRSKEDTSINLTPNSSIVLTGYTKNSDSSILYLPEVFRDLFIHKLQQIIIVLSAYIYGEIDILDGDGIVSKYGKLDGIIKMGKAKLTYEVCVRESKGDVGVRLSFDNFTTELAVYDFIDLCSKIKSINYMSMTMSCINYLGRPEIGTNCNDSRVDYYDFNDDEDQNSIQVKTNTASSVFSGLDVIPKKGINQLDHNKGW